LTVAKPLLKIVAMIGETRIMDIKNVQKNGTQIRALKFRINHV